MASVQVYTSRGHKYVRIVESYRDPKTGKPRTRTIKNLGNLEKLEEKEPGIVERLKKEYQEVRDDKENQDLKGSIKFIKDIIETEEIDEASLYNYGYLVFDKLWKKFNLDYFFNYRQSKTKIEFKTTSIAKMLTYQRLLYPASKKKSYETMDRLFNLDSDFALHQIYRALSFYSDNKENLEIYLNKKLAEFMDRNLTVCFYDVTSYYFESQMADEFRKFGFSKDKKFNEVQIIMGLLIDSHGIPVSYELFPGNTSEFKTLEPVLIRLKEDYGINKVIISADRGLNSKNNLALIRSLGYDYVMAYKIKSSSKAIKDLVTDLSDYERLNQDMLYKETSLEQRVRLSDGTFTEFTDKFILTHSSKRAKKDRADRQRLVEKAKKLKESPSMFKSEMKKGGKKYIQLSIEEANLELDEDKIERDSRYDGFYGYVSSDKNLDASVIIEIYHNLWKIEESFRVMKSNLEARPHFVWTEESIRGHFVICYLALFIERYLEYLLKSEGVNLSTQAIQDSIRSATVSVLEREKGTDVYIKNQANDKFSEILRVLKFKEIPSAGKVSQIKI